MLSFGWLILTQSGGRKRIGRAFRILAFGEYFIEQANEKPKRFFFVSKNQNDQTSNIIHSLAITDTWIWFIILIQATVLFTSHTTHSDFFEFSSIEVFRFPMIGVHDLNLEIMEHHQSSADFCVHSSLSGRVCSTLMCQ